MLSFREYCIEANKSHSSRLIDYVKNKERSSHSSQKLGPNLRSSAVGVEGSAGRAAHEKNRKAFDDRRRKEALAKDHSHDKEKGRSAPNRLVRKVVRHVKINRALKKARQRDGF